MSLSSGIFLDEWKSSFLIPIFKSGSKNDIENYRGICKLSALPKLFESMVKSKIEFSVKELFCDTQHGFVTGRSTTTNLACLSHYTINAIEDGYQVDCVYTDFSKAFDSVNHLILLRKLECFGFHSAMLDWIRSYLIGRIQRVKIDNYFSRSFGCSSGVPQGSHLGPLLFIIFINDISCAIKYSHCLMYADDLKLFLKIKTSLDCEFLQYDLRNLSVWCVKNCLHLNIKKCCIISFYRSSYHLEFLYEIDTIGLNRVDEVKDLGIIIDSRFTFASHIDHVIAKANKLCGFIKRNSREFSDPHTLISLFIALVRSLLEYADVIWTPFYKIHSDRLEKIQRRFTKYIFRKMSWDFEISYRTRCQLLSISTLCSRRKAHDIMLIRDLLCYHIKCPSLLALVPIYAPTRPLRERNLLLRPVHRTNYGHNEPMSRAIVSFNDVYIFVDLYYSRDRFKSVILDLAALS